MFSGSSVIILGAGTSYDFGLPLGGSLFGDIVGMLEKCKALGREGGTAIELSARNETFEQDPVSFVLRRLLLDQAPGDFFRDTTLTVGGFISQVKRARDALKQSTAETIDEFLTLNPSYVPICKILMTTCFFRKLYTLRDWNFYRTNLSSRNPRTVSNRNWIHLFINTYRTNLLRGRNPPPDKIRIVTFNYDSIFQTVLDELFTASERNVGPWRDHFTIYDVYGSFIDLPLTTQDPFQLIWKWAQNIRTVDEVKENSGSLAEVRSAVNNADTVYAAGFAFASDNCELIGLNTRSKSKPLWYINYDGSPGLVDRVDRYASRSCQKPFTKDDKPMTMDRAIGLGLFGEMPM